MTTSPSAEELDALAAAVAATEVPLDAAEQRAALAAYGLLAGGHAFTARSLAERIGWSSGRAETFLARHPRLERDELGRVVGFRGVSLKRTTHAAAVGHQVLYAWSAWDCLVVPLVVDAATRIRSTCPVTERPIEVIATPTGLRRRTPDSAVVSLRSPQATSPEHERGASRALSRFLADREAGSRWAARTADTLLLDLEGAFEVARRALRASFGDVVAR